MKIHENRKTVRITWLRLKAPLHFMPSSLDKWPSMSKFTIAKNVARNWELAYRQVTPYRHHTPCYSTAEHRTSTHLPAASVATDDECGQADLVVALSRLNVSHNTTSACIRAQAQERLQVPYVLGTDDDLARWGRGRANMSIRRFTVQHNYNVTSVNHAPNKNWYAS